MLDGQQSACKVLLVEDEYIIALDLAQTLERHGLQVLGPVGTLEGALDLLSRETDIAGAVLDISIRGAKVYPVAEALQRRRVPFVFVTAYQREDLPDAFRHVGYLAKPVAASQVVRTLQGMLAPVTGGTRQTADIA